MKPRFPSLLIPCLCLGLSILLPLAGCDDGGDNVAAPGDGEAPVVDLSRFVGAWMIRDTGRPSILCTNDCEDQMRLIVSTYFDIPVTDSVCVRIDTLTDLVLVEPYYSGGTDCTGAVFNGTDAEIDCRRRIAVGGDTLLTLLSGDILLQNDGATLQAFFTVSVDSADCSSTCMALVGIGGVRRVSDECGR